MDEPNITQILSQICSAKKLERDRAVPELEKFLSTADKKLMESIAETIITKADTQNANWETTNGALLAVNCLLNFLTPGDEFADLFAVQMRTVATKLLTHEEVRVRLAAGEVLGNLCKKYGSVIYADTKDVVLNLIQSNLERELNEDSSLDYTQKEKLIEKFSSSNRGVDAATIFHDTAGWKFLETSMKAFQCMVDGCGVQFEPFITQELLDLIFQSLSHTNRFVRETGYYVCLSIIACSFPDAKIDGEGHLPKGNESSPIFIFGHQFSRYLGLGLTDNWSQVRLAAAMAARKFLMSLPEESRKAFFPELLPKLCLNRYYLAEGVRLYSQETWRQVAGTEGRELVQIYIEDVVKHYISQTDVDNHAVREAACSCIAELAVKINPEVVRPFVPQLLKTLVVCFQDDSWPVRDSACLASGNFIVAFPDESKSVMDTLYPLFFTNLEDTIPSVRQGASSALTNVVKTYGEAALLVVAAKVKDGLGKVATQQVESEKYSGIDKGPAPFGVVKRMRDNDMELHTDQVMYSCGSLAPKMGRGGSCGCSGAMNRTFRKPPEPWELADGCVYLVSELASIPAAASHMHSLIELVAKAATYRHYTHHICLLETICKQLPVIAQGIGKKNFKQYIEMFIEPVFYSLNCENALTSSAASQCLNQLGSLLGPNILRSRVEQFNPSYLPQLDANLHIAPY